MKKEILEVLHKNVEVSLAIEQNVILEWDFEKVAEELDALFAKRIVVRQSEQLKCESKHDWIGVGFPKTRYEQCKKCGTTRAF